MIEVTTETVAKALVINELNQALVLTVGEYKERPDKSYKPDLPGGVVDIGESEREAVVREIREEVGIDISTSDIQLAYSETSFFDQERKSVTKLLYLARLDHTPYVQISWEHASYEWVTIEGIKQLTKFSPFYNTALEYCLELGLIK